jgi:hypothetical protein
MKKTLFLSVLFLVFVSVLMFVGCSKSSPTTPSATDTPNGAQQTQTAQAQLPTATPTMTPNMTATEGIKQTQTAVAGLPAQTQTAVANATATAAAQANATATAQAQAQETTIAQAQETATMQAQQMATWYAQETLTALATATAQAQETQTAVSGQPAATQTALAAANATATAQANATATAIAQSLGTISGTVTFPGTKPGENYQVIIVQNLQDVSNDSLSIKISGVLGTETSITYTANNIPAGTYFVLAATMPTNGAPVIGDYVGICGATYPSFPSSPNVVVTANSTVIANVNTVAVSNQVSGTIYLPSPIVTAAIPYQVMLYTSQQAFVDGSPMNSSYGTMGGAGGVITNNISAPYSIPLLLPGTYYIEVWIDVNGSQYIQAGDYTYSGTIQVANPIININNDINLTASNVQP